VRRLSPDGIRWRFAAEPAEAAFQTADPCPCLPIDPGAFNLVAQCCSLAVWASTPCRAAHLQPHYAWQEFRERFHFVAPPVWSGCPFALARRVVIGPHLSDTRGSAVRPIPITP
jgi:hypothetical protein